MTHHRHLERPARKRKSGALFGSVFLWTLCFQAMLVLLAGQAVGEPNRGTPSSHYREASPKTLSHPHGSDVQFSTALDRQLDLDGEQAAAFEKIETEYKVMTIRKSADIRIAEVELAALLEKDEPNLELVEQKIKDIGALRTELMMGRVNSLLKLRTVLTDEQYDRFRHILRERMEQMTNHHPRLMGH